MPEQLAEVAGRFVWGHPNTDEAGRLIRESNCRHCTHWMYTGWILWESRHAEGCSINQSAHFPNEKNCKAFAREPGSDDE